ncbi:MAG: methionine--tRNA ligase [Spirochaetales bacterium]|nr:methionine--tRNA ligase [Spirochaetales bacterium]
MKKRLITSALPYVNNIPHLGNLIQVLSADVFARFCRAKGYETLYVCGTDEYGTATETRALEEGISPKELCDRFHEIHKDIYQWFNIDFDHFGRTSTQKQTEIVQHIFNEVDRNGYISEKTDHQQFCNSCQRFLADRYVRGTCPHCGYDEARGDQCENCGKLLEPTELIEPKCGTCQASPELKETKHLYIDLPKVLPLLEEWMNKASVDGFWANNAIAMTKSWIRDGLKERCITRDLKWGIPVPKEGFEDKVFYVWFDAPIGYISITANYTDNWEYWWRNPEEVELFQFIGKDNIPFHTVIFPSSLLATREKWTMLHHMSSTEYLNYEDLKFSKSKGTGVFGNDAKDTGIPADVWRFYIFFNRPEKSDVQFLWSDFQDKINKELIGNYGNLINRSLSFLSKFYNGEIPKAELNKDLRAAADKIIAKSIASYDRADLRDAFRSVFELADLGNKAFQDGEPWKKRATDPEETASLLRTLVTIVRDIAILSAPVMPETARKILDFFQTEISTDFSELGKDNIDKISQPTILFQKYEDDFIEELRQRYAGNQKDRIAEITKNFSEKVDLQVGKIKSISRHPEADKLYVEEIDLGDETRQIVSGLVPYYSEEELLGKNVIVVKNLKSATLRGVLSEGMILAAEGKNAENKKTLEVLSPAGVKPGDKIYLNNFKPAEIAAEITIDEFFNFEIEAKECIVKHKGLALTCNNKEIKTSTVKNGKIS